MSREAHTLFIFYWRGWDPLRLLQSHDAHELEGVLLGTRLADAFPHLADEVLLVGDLGTVHQFSHLNQQDAKLLSYSPISIKCQPSNRVPRLYRLTLQLIDDFKDDLREAFPVRSIEPLTSAAYLGMVISQFST